MLVDDIPATVNIEDRTLSLDIVIYTVEMITKS